MECLTISHEKSENIDIVKKAIKNWNREDAKYLVCQKSRQSFFTYFKFLTQALIYNQFTVFYIVHIVYCTTCTTYSILYILYIVQHIQLILYCTYCMLYNIYNLFYIVHIVYCTTYTTYSILYIIKDFVLWLVLLFVDSARPLFFTENKMKWRI